MQVDKDRQQIEADIANARKFVDLRDALNKLEANRDFKKVIKEALFRDEAVRLVHLKADPAFQTPERQESINKQIDAIGYLSSFFRTIDFNAAQALSSIAQSELMLADMDAGDDE
jgi:hypothetical protein